MELFNKEFDVLVVICFLTNRFFFVVVSPALIWLWAGLVVVGQEMLLSLMALTGLPAAHPVHQLCSETTAVITSHLQGFSPFVAWVRGDFSI